MAKISREYKGVRIVETQGYFLVDLGVKNGWEFFTTMKEAEAFVDERLSKAKPQEPPASRPSDSGGQ
jgi:hypothetical protein